MAVFIPATDVRRTSDEPFKYDQFVVRPHVDYSFLYGTGIQAGLNNPQTTTIQSLSPGMSLDLGAHWTLDYTPTLTFYSNKQFQNTLGHAASLTGATHYGDWTLNLSQTYTLSTSPLAETAEQTEQSEYVTSLNASYAINDRMSADFGVNQDFQDDSGFDSSKNWSTMEWLNYEFWNRLNVGVGVGGGYDDLESQGDQDNQMLQARVNWRATDKLSLGISGGLEEQEFATPGESDELNPIFNASLQYQPFKHTQISFSASRSIGSDLFQAGVASPNIVGVSEGGSQITTGVSLSLNQQLLKKFNLNLSIAYNENDFSDSFKRTFDSVTQIEAINRTDTGYVFSARLSRSFLKRGTCALTFQNSENNSTAAGFSYNSTQVGFEVGYRY